MKNIFLVIMAIFTVAVAKAQSMADVGRAFGSANTSYIVGHLDNSVEITFGGKNSAYNKAQATSFLNNFFQNNKVSDFKVLHQSESGSTAYLIGNLATSQGNYRLTLFSRQKSGRNMLQEIRLEK